MNIRSRKTQLQWLLTCVCLLGSAAVGSLGLLQDEDEPLISCIEIGPFESHIRASLQNRILQIQTELKLSEAQTKRLRVVAKRVTQREANPKLGTFHFGNPLLSKFWLSNLEKVLSEEQRAQLVDLDAAVIAQREAAKKQFDLTPNTASAKSGFVATNLQAHLYLSQEQTRLVRQLLKSHLEEIGDRNWDPKLTPFYEANQEQLEEALAESQRLFFDGNSLINGIGDQSVWDREWRKATCTDCHAN